MEEAQVNELVYQALETEHLYHTTGWCREKSAIGAARSKQDRHPGKAR